MRSASAAIRENLSPSKRYAYYKPKVQEFVFSRASDMQNYIMSSSTLYIGAIMWTFVLYYADYNKGYSG